jgi:exonuclease VII large subunit
MFNEMTAVHGDAAQREIAEYMWAHEPQFKQTLLDLRKAAIQMRKTKGVMAKAVIAAKEKIEADLSAEITAIKERIAMAKTEYKDSEARKAMMKAETTYTRLVDNLYKRWGLNLWTARRALEAVPDAMHCLDHRRWGRRGYTRLQSLNIMLE